MNTKKKVKKSLLSVFLALVMLLSGILSQTVCAASNPNVVTEVVYVDGLPIKVSVNAAAGTIEARPLKGGDQSVLKITEKGQDIVRVYEEDEKRYVKYDLDVTDISQEEVDVEVRDKTGEAVEKYNSPEDLVQDSYQGQSAAAVTVVTGASVSALLSAVLMTAACIIVGGIIYYAGKAAVNVIKRSSSKKSYYYKAHVFKQNVYIGLNSRISKSAAVSRIRTGGADNDIYTYFKGNAVAAVRAARLGCTHAELSCFNIKGKVKFWHYHTGNRNGAHAFYGLPVVC